jgi:hypothetical protein
MQSTDREEFNALLRKFMGGYDAFPNPDKIEAYWTGLQKMTLSQLSRIIDHALSEEGPDKLPNVHGVWDLHRDMRRTGSNGIAPVHEAPPGEKPVATLQEQLCAYAMDKLRLSPSEICAPWEYRYREWWVDGKRNSTLTAVLIMRDNFVVSSITVAEMFADIEGHAKVMSMFKRIGSPRPPRETERKAGLTPVGALVAAQASAGVILLEDPVVSPAEEEAAENFFDEPITW